MQLLVVLTLLLPSVLSFEFPCTLSDLQIIHSEQFQYNIFRFLKQRGVIGVRDTLRQLVENVKVQPIAGDTTITSKLPSHLTYKQTSFRIEEMISGSNNVFNDDKSIILYQPIVVKPQFPPTPSDATVSISGNCLACYESAMQHRCGSHLYGGGFSLGKRDVKLGSICLLNRNYDALRTCTHLRFPPLLYNLPLSDNNNLQYVTQFSSWVDRMIKVDANKAMKDAEAERERAHLRLLNSKAFYELLVSQRDDIKKSIDNVIHSIGNMMRKNDVLQSVISQMNSPLKNISLCTDIIIKYKNALNTDSELELEAEVLKLCDQAILDDVHNLLISLTSETSDVVKSVSDIFKTLEDEIRVRNEKLQDDEIRRIKEQEDELERQKQNKQTELDIAIQQEKENILSLQKTLKNKETLLSTSRAELEEKKKRLQNSRIEKQRIEKEIHDLEHGEVPLHVKVISVWLAIFLAVSIGSVFYVSCGYCCYKPAYKKKKKNMQALLAAEAGENTPSKIVLPTEENADAALLAVGLDEEVNRRLADQAVDELLAASKSSKLKKKKRDKETTTSSNLPDNVEISPEGGNPFLMCKHDDNMDKLLKHSARSARSGKSLFEDYSDVEGEVASSQSFAHVPLLRQQSSNQINSNGNNEIDKHKLNTSGELLSPPILSPKEKSYNDFSNVNNKEANIVTKSRKKEEKQTTSSTFIPTGKKANFKDQNTKIDEMLKNLNL